MQKWLYWLWRVLPIPKKLRGHILWAGNRKFIIGIAALILNNAGEILLFKHTYRTDCDWGFPGGYLKSHEDPDAAIQREIFEESGLAVRVLGVLEIIRSEDMARLEVLYRAVLRGEWEFKPSHEVSEARFFPLDQLPELLPEHQALIEKYGVEEKKVKAPASLWH
jgi:ADP-ribose pyrophosphatase YjhB (NUDIX family)